jgi:hypothetical protein
MQKIQNFLTLLKSETSNRTFFLLIIDQECKACKQISFIWPIWMERFWETQNFCDSFRWAIRNRKQIPKWVEYLEIPKEHVPVLVSFPDKPSIWGLEELWSSLEFCSPLDEIGEYEKFSSYIQQRLKECNSIVWSNKDKKQPIWEYFLEIMKTKQ